MSLKPFDGFQSLETHHCVTGSLRHIYEFYDHPLSEEMLLGIGSGVSFIYWHSKGMAPFFGGRGNVGRPGEEGLEITAGRRTGVHVEKHHTSSTRKAEKSLLELLEARAPVMLNVDMGYLPYFDLPEDYHFGAHAIVVCGYDPDTKEVLIADRDTSLHPVPWEALAQARSSTYKPFPPGNMWFTFDFSQKRQPTKAEIWEAIGDVCENMLHGPISNIGVRGIRKAARQVFQWPQKMSTDEIRWTCFNTYIFIDAIGGTGGGLFRTMYARFLHEAAEIMQDNRLFQVSDNLKTLGDQWQEVAQIFKHASSIEDPATILPKIISQLLTISENELHSWSKLHQIISKHP
jgi:hypothetical protein